MENLNDDVLLEIFKYCGKCETLSLTCKRFYDLVCNLKRNKYRAKMYSQMFNHEGIYGSLVNSHKVFDELEIYCSSLSDTNNSIDFNGKIKAIFKVKGANIKKLTLNELEIDARCFFNMMNYLPNLEKLSLKYLVLKNGNKSRGTLNLQFLKDLFIASKDFSTATFFGHHLPRNKLASLDVDYHFPKLLMNQQSLRSLILYADVSKWSPIAGLTKLKIIDRSQGEKLCSILKKQPDLEELDIKMFYGAINGNAETFDSLCNLKKLKVLIMDVGDLLNVEVETNFPKLKMLEELELFSYLTVSPIPWISYPSIADIILDISFINFENLKKLTLHINFIEITVDHIKQMGENYPHLNCLKLISQLPLTLDTFLDSFESLNSLTVEYMPKREFSTICSTLKHKFYPNIKNLELYGLHLNDSSYQLSIEKLKKSFPDLENMSFRY